MHTSVDFKVLMYKVYFNISWLNCLHLQQVQYQKRTTFKKMYANNPYLHQMSVPLDQLLLIKTIIKSDTTFLQIHEENSCWQMHVYNSKQNNYFFKRKKSSHLLKKHQNIEYNLKIHFYGPYILHIM